MTAPTIPRTASKALVACVAILAVLVLAGCPRRAEVIAAEAAAQKRPYDWMIIPDAATGCEYVVYAGKGITPRIAADGRTHMGCTRGEP